MKVKFFDRDLIKSYFKIWSVVSIFLSFILIFITIPNQYKRLLGILFTLLLIVSYIIMWIYANKSNTVRLKINSNNVKIIIGDIFQQEGLKVIGVNDFIDTIADDILIAKGSLHGKFLDKYSEKIAEIDFLIRDDEYLKQNVISIEEKRAVGKKKSYKLGSVVEYDSYVLTPFAKFNNENKAYITVEEYIEFWMNFWGNIDRIYAGRNINIPLMGAGITRFHGVKPSKQELLETMLWTLKISGFCCTYSNHRIKFIIYPDDIKEINLYKVGKGFS